ncbi:MAG TPA: hypothetical protein PLP01_02055 [Phycisphaerae bacterium]|nr:hypothetical protein [Phycisphaerae bacterium]
MKNHKDYEPLDLSGLKMIGIADRKHLVTLDSFGRVPPQGATVSDFVASLPRTPVTRAMNELADAIVAAHEADCPVVMAMGAHVIKVGLAPLVIDLIDRGIVTAVALNGAGAIHDLEIAMHGETSEDVKAGLTDGSFGMVEETPAHMNDAAMLGRHRGLGRAVGDLINEDEDEFPNAAASVLAAASRLDAVATVHVAVGTDTVHMHPDAPGGAIGAASLLDFRKVCAVVSDMTRGVWLNVGSAVVLPEVFLKAYTVAVNLGHDLSEIVTANFDQILHYRPRVNVLERPSRRGYALTGHHEIMVPLLHQMIVSRL